jgi:hypothetical protein
MSLSDRSLSLMEVKAITCPREAASHLGLQGHAVGARGLMVLDANGAILLEAAISAPDPPREVLRLALRAGPAGAGIVAFVVVESVDTGVDLEMARALALRVAGEAIGLPLLDFIVLGTDPGAEVYRSIRVVEGWA